MNHKLQKNYSILLELYEGISCKVKISNFKNCDKILFLINNLLVSNNKYHILRLPNRYTIIYC